MIAGHAIAGLHIAGALGSSVTAFGGVVELVYEDDRWLVVHVKGSTEEVATIAVNPTSYINVTGFTIHEVLWNIEGYDWLKVGFQSTTVLLTGAARRTRVSYRSMGGLHDDVGTGKIYVTTQGTPGQYYIKLKLRKEYAAA